MSGQQAGSFIGGVIGSYFGPVGYAIGAAIGGAVGGYIDPTVIKGPRLTDATQQTAQDGIPIPWGFGTFPTTGNIIWRTDLRERKKEDDGKGTGIVNVTYHYYRDYAVGICQGVRQTDGTYLPIEGILQVKKNGKIVYDVQPGASTNQAALNARFLRNVRFYLGSETQAPDSVLETHLGVNNTPAFPGTVYMVVENEEQPDGAIPQWAFVVSLCGTSTPAMVGGQWWLTHTSDTDAQNSKIWFSEDALTWPEESTRSPDIYNSSGQTKRANGGATYAGNGQMIIYSESPTGGDSYVEVIEDPNTLPLATSIVAVGSSFSPSKIRFFRDTLSVPRNGSDDILFSTNHGVSWILNSGPETGITEGIARLNVGTWLCSARDGTQSRFNYSGVGIPDSGNWTDAGPSSPVGKINYGIWSDGNSAVSIDSDGNAYTTTTGAGWVTSAHGMGTVTPFCGVGFNGIYVLGCQDGGIARKSGSSWTLGYLGGSSVSGRNIVKIERDQILGTIVVSCTDNTVWVSTNHGLGFTESTLPFNPAPDNDTVRVGFHPFYEPAKYVVPDSPEYTVDDYGNLVGPSSGSLERCKPTLGEIVAEVCYRSGLIASDIDVSQLTDEVDGFKVATESTGEAIIGPLMQGWFFDAGEFDDRIRFIKRGGNVSAELTVSDLCETDGDIIEETELQEAELLRKVHIKTIDPGSEFTITTQTAERRTSTVLAKGEQTTEIAVVTDKDTQAQIAAKKLKVGWAETRRFGWTLPYTRPDLTVTDVIGITDDKGRRQRVRLMEISEDSGRIHVKEAMLDRQSSYTSNVEGVSHTAPILSGQDLIGPTDLSVMNLSSLRSSDNTPGVYLAAAGFLSGWPGAVIFMSSDGGVTYQEVATFTDPSTMGILTEDMDSSEVLSVFLRAGTLSSVTTDQINQRFNGFAITTNDVSELGQFQTATLDSNGFYVLTDLFRGQMGTVVAPHYAGDHFVLVTTAKFLPIDISLSGETLYFKAVSVGTSPDDAESIPFVFEPPTFVIDGGEVT